MEEKNVVENPTSEEQVEQQKKEIEVVYQLIDNVDNQVILETVNQQALIVGCDGLPVDVSLLIETADKRREEEDTTPVTLTCHPDIARAIYYQYSHYVKMEIERQRVQQEQEESVGQ